jgi:Flp pilus assembly protein TadD
MHDPDNGLVHATLGKVQLFLGETESAIASLREAVRLDPKDLDAKSWLEIALAER